MIKGVGGFQHNEWRSFHSERRNAEARNILDGDLIEGFLELSREDMERVVDGTGVSMEDAVKLIDELTRLH